MEPPPTGLLAGPLGPTIRIFARKIGLAATGEPVEVSSWFRTPLVNEQEGGDEESQHLYGLGIDLIGPLSALERVEQRVWLNGAVAVMESDHLHTQEYPKGVLAACGFGFPPPRF